MTESKQRYGNVAAKALDETLLECKKKFRENLTIKNSDNSYMLRSLVPDR